MFAVAEFLAIIAGGIDVSFPALASLSAYASTKILLDQNYDGNVVLAFVIAMAIGALLGAVNGFLIGYLNLNAMIVTLGTSSVFQGFMQGATAGKTVICYTSWYERVRYKFVYHGNEQNE